MDASSVITPERISLAKPWFGSEEASALLRVLESGWIVQGPEVASFEESVAALHGLPYAVAVSSATAGLHLMYLSLGIGRGDVVFIPSFAWPSAANMAIHVGASPFFVDVDPITYNITAATLLQGIERVKRLQLGRPRAVVVVHEFGLAAPMTELLHVAEEEELYVFEDAACALGSTYQAKPVGHFGRSAVFSFHPRKSISTGEGGIVLCSEKSIADSIRVLRNHGQDTCHGHRDFVRSGFNYRLTEFQAALGRAQMQRLSEILSIKRSLASCYFRELTNVAKIQLPTNHPEHTWQTFMIILPSADLRNHLQNILDEQNIEAGPGSVAVHASAHWKDKFLSQKDSCPVSTRLAMCGLALPLHPLLTDLDVRRIAAVIKKTFAI